MVVGGWSGGANVSSSYPESSGREEGGKPSPATFGQLYFSFVPCRPASCAHSGPIETIVLDQSGRIAYETHRCRCRDGQRRAEKQGKS